jgi:integrin beta 3
VSGWGQLSNCSAPCGAGVKTKNRTVTTEPENGGAACPALEESEACNTGACQFDPGQGGCNVYMLGNTYSTCAADSKVYCCGHPMCREQHSCPSDSGKDAIVPKNEELAGEGGAEYQGGQTLTRSGHTCQAWKSQKPHTHKYTPESYPAVTGKRSGLVSNFCRNPSGNEGGLWCYTTDQNERWENCDPIVHLEPCPGGYVASNKDVQDGSFNVEIWSQNEEPAGEGGAEYQGEQTLTQSGHTCQAWASQKPHTHKYTPEDYPPKPGKRSKLVSNFCRNPSGNEGGLWCYTTDQNKRWENCDPKTDPNSTIGSCGALCNNDTACSMFEYSEEQRRCRISSGALDNKERAIIPKYRRAGIAGSNWQSCIKGTPKCSCMPFVHANVCTVPGGPPVLLATCDQQC